MGEEGITKTLALTMSLTTVGEGTLGTQMKEEAVLKHPLINIIPIML